MKLLKYLPICLVCLLASCAKSNNSFTSFGGDKNFKVDSPPNSQSPGGEKRGFWGTPKTSGIKYDDKYFKQQQKDQEKRMKAVARKHKKEAKMAENPQYSDPMYFGHKRPPKKRKPGKKKFCKVCELVH